MKRLVLPATLILLALVPARAQNIVEIARDNGNPRGYHARPGWEESVILQPKGPATIVKLRIHYSGAVAGRDTIHIVGDPSEGSIPPTSYVWTYNHLTDPIVIEYSGTPGWVEIPLDGRGIRSDGFDRIVIQHRINWNRPTGGAKVAVGPFFSHDGNPASPYTSFLYNPDTTNSYGFPGVYFLGAGDMLVRLGVVYDNPMNDTSAPPPTPALVDRTVASGLVGTDGKPVKSSRVSVIDFDLDGDDDVAIGSTFFRNKGDGTFETAALGITGAAASAWADFDNDGDLDCYAINGGAADALWRNDAGTFVSVKATAGIDNPRPTVTPIWLDFDRDGNLDLFIANGRTEVSGNETYFPDVLFMNNGDGTFQDVTSLVGFPWAEPAPYYDCWAASASDFNQDGFPDIHVATYRLAPDLLYENQKNGTFSDVGGVTGVVGMPTQNAAYFGHGLGSDWGDFNNDALPDLAVGNLGHPDWRGAVSNPSLIFRNAGSSSVEWPELHAQMGLKFFEMNAGVLWLDLDLDGNLDLWSCQYAYNAAGGSEPRRLSRMYMSGGPAENWRLHDRTWQLGSVIHGAWTAARGDFDRDGRIDLVVASPHEGVRLFHNELQANGRFVAIRLVGKPSSDVPTEGVGSRVKVYAGGRVFYRELIGAGGGVTSTQNASELHFGLGMVESIDSVVVEWSNGTHQKIEGGRIGVNKHYRIAYEGEITELATSAVPVSEPPAAAWALRSAQYRDGAFIIVLSGEVPSGARLEVADLLGHVVASRTLDPACGTEHLPAEVGAGVYVVRLVVGDDTRSVKVIVG